MIKEEETDKITIIVQYEEDRADRYSCELVAGKLFAGERRKGSTQFLVALELSTS